MNTWERFTLYDMVAPNNAACGNVHFAPNSEHDYDWGNKRVVWSTCDDWLNYPALSGNSDWSIAMSGVEATFGRTTNGGSSICPKPKA